MKKSLSLFSTATLVCVALFLSGFQKINAAPSKTAASQPASAPLLATPLSKELRSMYYYLGMQFSIMAIMMFKQHKDNPTQIPIGVPNRLAALAVFFFLAGNWTVPAPLQRLTEKF